MKSIEHTPGIFVLRREQEIWDAHYKSAIAHGWSPDNAKYLADSVEYWNYICERIPDTAHIALALRHQIGLETND